MTNKSAKRISLASILFVTVLTTVLLFAGCGPAFTNSEEEENMSKDQIVEQNTASLLEYYEREGLFGESSTPQESAAEKTAGVFSEVSEYLIASIDSELRSGGAATITVTDTNGDIYHLYISESGLVGKVTDSNGEIIYAVVM